MSTQQSFSVRVSPSAKTVDLVGSWDNFSKPLYLDRDRSSSRSGTWRGKFRFSSSTLVPVEEYWYYFIVDGHHSVINPRVPSIVEPNTGQELNVLVAEGPPPPSRSWNGGGGGGDYAPAGYTGRSAYPSSKGSYYTKGDERNRRRDVERERLRDEDRRREHERRKEDKDRRREDDRHREKAARRRGDDVRQQDAWRREKKRRREDEDDRRRLRSTPQNSDIPKGRPVPTSKIRTPKAVLPYATKHILNYEEADFEALASQLGTTAIVDDQASVPRLYASSNFATSPSSGSSRSSGSTSPSSLGSGSGYSTPDVDNSACVCERYGITRKGDRVKMDCGGAVCGYGGDENTSICSSGSEIEFQPGPVRRRGLVIR